MSSKDSISVFFDSVFGSREAVDPLAEKSYRRVGSDASRIYGKFAYRSDPSVGAIPGVQEFQASGDTLLLDELVGSEALYVKVGDWGNPWLRLEEGDELARRFDKVFVTTGAAPDTAIPGLSRAVVEATFLHSWGTVKRKGEKGYGFRRGFKAFRGSVSSTAEQSLFAPLLAIAPGIPAVFGKRGGTVVVRNRDLANTLLLRFGTPGILGSDDYFELYPGETFTLPLEHRIHATADTLVVATAAGTCDYGAVVSAFDIDRADLDQTLLSGI